MKYSQDLERERKNRKHGEKIYNRPKTQKKYFATVEKWKIYCF